MAEFFNGVLIFFAYLIPLAIVIFLVRKFAKVEDELFRKILHFVLLGAYIPLLFGFEKWYHALIFIVCFGALIYPALIIAGKIPGFSAFVNERKGGEFKNSMILAVGIMAFSIIISGVIKDGYVVLASVYSWGIGDAFAALIGKRIGKHKINWKITDGKKSVEGSLAMLITSFIAVCALLLIRGGIGVFEVIVISILASTASTIVELCSKNGLDTVFCPIASMAIILPLTMLFGK